MAHIRITQNLIDIPSWKLYGIVGKFFKISTVSDMGTAYFSDYIEEFPELTSPFAFSNEYIFVPTVNDFVIVGGRHFKVEQVDHDGTYHVTDNDGEEFQFLHSDLEYDRELYGQEPQPEPEPEPVEPEPLHPPASEYSEHNKDVFIFHPYAIVLIWGVEEGYLEHNGELTKVPTSIVTLNVNGTVYVGTSACSPTDKFDRKEGLQRAAARAIENAFAKFDWERSYAPRALRKLIVDTVLGL